ncbi:MAG: amino acid permease [Chlorobi bacterium]|nr:amino acid permease [Chlorobiota bacterium]
MELESKIKSSQHKLNEIRATAICGNDISSSVLYVSALSIIAAGQYAWIALLVVAVVLYAFRKIYAEVVGALPLNGGAYNALLNTTGKSTASLAATLTLLSYIATAVISATEAMHYLHSIIPSFSVIIATIILLAIFMGLTIMGITESSFVAMMIFIFHLVSLIVLAGTIFYYLFQNGFDVFHANSNLPPRDGSVLKAIFWGFAAAMLGISGFESSANFVEEQKPGVFPKTLRNMWIVVSIFNPLMAFLALSLIPVPEISEHKTDLLSYMGSISGGSWLAIVVSVDAVLVLSGAVLTSFVGVSGLLERMTLDRILPRFLLKKNKKGSSYRIIILFFALSVSILLITKGEVEPLAGVYTISFLSVMLLFAIGNILLKLRRKKLPRPERASWFAVLFAIVAVMIALAGNLIKEPEEGQPYNIVIFTYYFVPTMLFIIFMLNRIAILKSLLSFVDYLFVNMLKTLRKFENNVKNLINEINSQEFVFFTKGDNIVSLNKVLLYIQKNEHTRKIKIVHIIDNKEQELPEKLLKDIEFLDREYPDIKIEFVEVVGEFSPEFIAQLSKEWQIPINFMFIGSPSDKFPYKLEDFGGLRLII